MIRKLTWRIVPLLGLVYVISFLDRVNLGFAALTMNKDLGIDAVEYGSAAGVFFIGYLAFQIPANFLLTRLGARRWMTIIMASWGLVSMAMAFADTLQHLLIARFLLGVTEAGFYPGAIVYLASWFPSNHRGKIVSYWMLAAPIAYIIGSPLSGVIMSSFDQVLGYAGWRWLFVLEALPAICVAPVVYMLLQDSPKASTWLMPEETAWLEGALAEGADPAAPAAKFRFGPILVAFALVYFLLQISVYGLGLWLPLIAADGGLNPLHAGYVTALPYVAAFIGMIIWGNRTRGVRPPQALDLTAPMMAAGLVLMASAAAHTFGLRLLGVSLMTMCLYAALPMFWAFCTTRHRAIFGALGVAAVNTVGGLGGFAGPVIVGWAKQNGGFPLALLILGAGLVVGAAIAVAASRPIRQAAPGVS